MDYIRELVDGGLHLRRLILERNGRHSAVNVTRIIEVKFAHRNARALRNDIRIDLELPLISLNPFGVLDHVRLLFRLEIHDLIGAAVPFDEEKYKQAIGVRALAGEKGYSTLERNSCRPSFDICGIWGGYTGEGAKTVLPSKAYAKVSCRLVPHQDHRQIEQRFAQYLRSIAPDTVQVTVTPLHGGQGYVCPISLPAYRAAEKGFENISLPAYRAAEKGFEKAFGRKPLAVRRGGSIPIISTFEQVLGIKTVLMGFGLESNAIHSPNENIPLDILRKGIEAVVEFYLEYGEG